MSDPITVTGMSGAGNDFIVVGPAAIEALGAHPEDWVRRVCARGVSLGADGVVFVQPRADEGIEVRFFNPDGSSAFCGNGSRCAARYAHLQGMCGPRTTLWTEAGRIPAVVDAGNVRLELPPPEDGGLREVTSAGTAHRGRFVTAGIPHFIVFVDDPDTAPLESWGPALRRHPDFGEAGTNVNLAAFEDHRIRLRTWERGVERETLCCWSGSVAVAYAARREGAPESLTLRPASGIAVRVELPGPPEAPTHAILEGEARVLFHGEVDPEAWAWPG